MNNDRGRGASGPKKPETMVPRYGVSPQLAPPVGSAQDKTCLNSQIVGTPQAAFDPMTSNRFGGNGRK